MIFDMMLSYIILKIVIFHLIVISIIFIKVHIYEYQGNA